MPVASLALPLIVTVVGIIKPTSSAGPVAVVAGAVLPHQVVVTMAVGGADAVVGAEIKATSCRRRIRNLEFFYPAPGVSLFMDPPDPASVPASSSAKLIKTLIYDYYQLKNWICVSGEYAKLRKCTKNCPISTKYGTKSKMSKILIFILERLEYTLRFLF
jgi:hypothetical protein